LLLVKKNNLKGVLGMEQLTINVDGREYVLHIEQKVNKPLDLPKIIIPAYQPNETAKKILEACIQSIQSNTCPEEYELWVVDNCSPAPFVSWLMDWPEINVISSRTRPLPQEQRKFFSRFAFWRTQKDWGSYANAVGLEIFTSVIDPETQFILTLHMDTMTCRSGWLESLRGMIDPKNRASGVCMEHVRSPEGVLHILGCLIDYQAMKKNGVDFFPDLPGVDVGDNVTIKFRQAGLSVKSLENTYENPELIAKIPEDSPYKNIGVMRTFDSKGNIVFMHLGRGIRKSDKTYVGESAATEEWLAFFNQNVNVVGGVSADDRSL